MPTVTMASHEESHLVCAAVISGMGPAMNPTSWTNRTKCGYGDASTDVTDSPFTLLSPGGVACFPWREFAAELAGGRVGLADAVDTPNGEHPASAGGIRLRLLQSFELVADGEIVMLPRGLQRVLAFLALGDRAVDRSRLAGLLWPEISESRAAANLRCSLWRLRQTGLSLVQSYGNTLQVDPAVRIDVHGAQAKANRLLGRDGGPLPQDYAVQDLMHDLLEDWYDDWLLMDRERFRQVRLHALESLCQLLIGRGCHIEAIEAGLGAVGGEPFRDSAQRVLITAYLAEGNSFEADRQYRSYGALLARNNMAGPAFALGDLARDLVRHRNGQVQPA